MGGEEWVMKRVVVGLMAAAMVLVVAGFSGAADGAGRAAAPKNHSVVVKYRCAAWLDKCFPSQAAAHAFETKLKGLGFQTYTTHQPDTYCVHYRLPAWRQKTFASQSQARALETWLKGIGCETQ